MPALDWQPVIWKALRADLEPTGRSARRRSTGHLYAVAVAAAMEAGVPTSEITFESVEALLAEYGEFGWIGELSVKEPESIEP